MSDNNMEWRFLALETRNGYWNMALDEAILDSVIKRESPNTVRFFKWKPSTISIGRNQSLSNEVNVNFAKERSFNIVRRITGGGSVFHDTTREITYSIVCPTRFLEKLNANKVIEQFEKIEEGIKKPSYNNMEEFRFNAVWVKTRKRSYSLSRNLFRWKKIFRERTS